MASSLAVCVADLLHARYALYSAILSTDLPAYVPLELDVTNPLPLIAEDLCELWHRKHDRRPPLPSGILCADSRLLGLVEAFNRQKIALRDAIQQAKGETQRDQKRRFKFEGYLPDSLLSEIKRHNSMAGFNLVTCYTLIRILPEDTWSVRWTWQKRPKGIESIPAPIVVDKLLARSATEIDESRLFLLNQAIQDVASLPAGDYVASVQNKQRPKLKVNILYGDRETPASKMYSCTGVMVLPASSLPPIIVYRQPPDPQAIPAPRTSQSVIVGKVANAPGTKTLYLYQRGHRPRSITLAPHVKRDA